MHSNFKEYIISVIKVFDFIKRLQKLYHIYNYKANHQILNKTLLAIVADKYLLVFRIFFLF